jgi:periplasmic copper chaperone A
MSSRTLARLGALPLAAGLLVAGAGAAAAHVTVTPSLTSAGSYSVLTFSVGHGCDGSPTTKIAVQMPEQVLAVTPTRNPEWEVEKQMATLDEPVEDAHGNEITERVDQVVYTARTPLPDGYRDTFELQLQLPDAAGETLTFPTIQTCEKGETAWIETPSAGQDPESLESPAPSFALDEAEAADEADTEPVAATTDETDETEAADDGGDALGIAGVVAGMLGLAAGVAALVLVRRRA